MIDKYINPHTDFGFKRLFGSEFNKELLISFLNAMFHGEQNVQDVTYLNSEQLGDRATLDVLYSTCIVRTIRVRSSSSRCRTYIRSSSRTAPSTIPLSLYASRHNVAESGTSVSTRSTPSVCSTSTLPTDSKMPSAGTTK